MKIKKRILSLAFAGALTLGLLPAFSSPALAADGDTSYTLTIPSTLSVANSGWNATDGISATGSLTSGKKLTVTAASTNSWALKQQDGSETVGYNLATATGTYSSSATPASWEFTELSNTAATKPMGIIVEDYSTKPAGTYTDTVTFTAKVENNTPAASLSNIRNNGAVLKLNYNTEAGDTQIILTNNNGTVSCTSYESITDHTNYGPMFVSVSLSSDTLTIYTADSLYSKFSFYFINNLYTANTPITSVKVNDVDITDQLTRVK